MGFATVNEYIDSLEEGAKRDVSGFGQFMKAKFPELTPKISFSMPMWWVGPKMYNGYVAVSAAKKHYSIHFLDESCLAKLKGELPGCTFGKRCINIPYGDEQSISVVRQVVKNYLSGLSERSSVE